MTAKGGYMRRKDTVKKENIIASAISLINEVGFAEASMSKIAKAAGVSPATLYTYFENKDDLLKELFIVSKKDMHKSIIKGIDASSATEATFRALLKNFIEYFQSRKDSCLFIEQFMNSPLIQKLTERDEREIESPFMGFFENGKAAGTLKQIDTELIFIYAISPLTQVAKKYASGSLELTDKNVATLIDMSWESIKR
jgi:AcrR family transcriptional regulator